MRNAADKASPTEIAEAKKMLEVFAGDVPAEVRPRLLYQACSESAECAQGCPKELSAAASVESIDDRAMILAQCDKLDYKARRDKGEKLSPNQWIEQHWKRVFDRLERGVDKADLKQWKAWRKQAKL